MLGNACEACGLEHVDDNTLQSHVSKNVKCRRKIQHSRAQRLVEAYRDALRARRGARPRSPVRSLRSYEGDSTERAAVEPGAVADQPDPPEGLEEDSDGGESVMSVIDDVFNTLVELYIFFREADLSRREVNGLLNILQNPNFSLRDVRRWLNFVDVRRYGRDRAPSDHVPWKTRNIKCYGPKGRICTLLLHYRDTELRQHARLEKWQTGGMAGPNQFVQHPGSAPLEGAGPRTGWGSAVPARVGVVDREDTHFPAVHGGDIRAPTSGAQRCYLERWNFAETTWGNVFHACAADLLHVLDGGMLPRMGKCFMIGRSKPERREFERRRKEQKKDTRACVVRIPGGTTWFSTGANYAAFEHRGMMQVMPLLIADNMEKSKPPAKAKRERMVAAIKASFPDQTSDWNIPKVHQIVHLIDGIPLHGMPNETSTNLWEHTHKGTVKVPVRGSNWHDIPRRIVEEEVQREIAREVAAEAGGNRQYVTALREAVRRMKPVLMKTSKRAHVDEDLDAVLWAYREAHGSDMGSLAGCMVAASIPTTTIEVHTAVTIPRTRGGELVPKGTFVKASPSKRWFSDIAVFRSDEEEWYARCLCIFRAKGADGEMGRHVYVKYYKEEGTCPMTTCF
ncbi:unnamed protein product [Closterium sp. NIES-64]|nr:unnamed protein product [Closterium sp. NIES-64]